MLHDEAELEDGGANDLVGQVYPPLSQSQYRYDEYCYKSEPVVKRCPAHDMASVIESV